MKEDDLNNFNIVRNLEKKVEDQKLVIGFLVIIIIILIFIAREAGNSKPRFNDEEAPSCYQTERGMECDY